MPLPDVIEIAPLIQPASCRITIPGSKSITNRALVLAALSEGSVILEGALWSEDTQVMVECLQRLGFVISVESDANESCNRKITVAGGGGRIPNSGTRHEPLELFVGNAGTAARFLAAMVCLGNGTYRLSGVPRMHQRPQAALFKALRDLGYTIDSTNEKLPALIHANGARNGACRVSIHESSQFASALLLCSQRSGWRVSVVGENADESPYVAMTTEMIAAFPSNGGIFQIEPDASSGSYFWSIPGPDIQVLHWPKSGWQIDERFPAVVSAFPDTISRQTDLGDSIMTAIALAAFQSRPKLFTDLGRLRVQECERVAALRTELRKCGVEVMETGDTLRIGPARSAHGADIETYNDHRMAMCFAVFGLRVPGIRIQNPSCVKKTFPNFFQKLAGSPPHGAGASILDPRSRAPLSPLDLFAE